MFVFLLLCWTDRLEGRCVPSTQHHVGSQGFRSLLPPSAFGNITEKREGPSYLFIVKV